MDGTDLYVIAGIGERGQNLVNHHLGICVQLLGTVERNGRDSVSFV